MRDPYLFEDKDVLKNKLGIINQELLEQAEADYVVLRMKEIALNPLPGDYHTEHFFRMHEYIFQEHSGTKNTSANIAPCLTNKCK